MNPTPRTDALLDQVDIRDPDDANRLADHARQLEHELGTRPATHPDQLAACRMVVGQLHAVLKGLRTGVPTPGTLRAIDEALAASEPLALDVMAKARAVAAARFVHREREDTAVRSPEDDLMAVHVALLRAADELAEALQEPSE